MAELTVGLGERSYPIVVEPGCLDHIGAQLAAMDIGNRYAIIADDYVASLYAERLGQSLRDSGIRYELFTFSQGEENKNLATFAELASALAEAHFDRHDAIVALGGGVTGDLAGYLASSYMRGIPFVQVPTTLLAQVDSSVGGKTGLDLPQGKNLLGAFYQPRAVFIDPEVLSTLARDQLLGGVAEVIKYGVIWDRSFFDFLAENREAILSLDPAVVETTILRCCAIKAEVVARDEREGGLRMILNYGHTIGHAVEAESSFSLIHGLAVAIGMVAAARLAVLREKLSGSELTEIEELLLAYGFDIEVPDEYSRERIMGYLQVDKKCENGQVLFILPVSIGATTVVRDISVDDLQSVLSRKPQLI